MARAARAALQWRLLLLWAAILLIPTAVLALPVWETLGANLDHSVYAASLARELDLSAIADLVASQARDSAAFSNAAFTALLLTLLLSPLLSGMVVGAARRDQPAGLRALVAGGLQEYPRMLRMLILALVPLGLAAALGGAAQGAAARYGEQAILESDAHRAALIASVVFGLLLVLAHATLDAGRAMLVTDHRRRSVTAAWWDGCKLLVTRPFATLGVYLGISMAGLLPAALLTVARINLVPAGVGSFIGALLLTQLIVLVLAWMRSARLFAIVELARGYAKSYPGDVDIAAIGRILP